MHRIGPVLVDVAAIGPDRSTSGDALLASLVSALAPWSGTRIARRCPRCGGSDHGAPVPLEAPVVLSVAYAGRLAVGAAALAREAEAVGVDVERGEPGTVLSDLANLLDPPPTLRGWTRIEAALKADGRGLRVPPGDVRIRGERARIPGRDGPIALYDVPAPDGFVVSLAIAARPSRARR
jgi:4'-phosphopantetheinyl transferase